jgi:predicted RNase H-like HicB family nuclease
MDPRIARYLKHEWTVGLDEESRNGERRFAAYLLELPGCIVQGASPHEAMERLHDVMPAYFESLVRTGVEPPTVLPEPSMIVGHFEFDSARPAGSAIPLAKPPRSGREKTLGEFRLVQGVETTLVGAG